MAWHQETVRFPGGLVGLQHPQRYLAPVFDASFIKLELNGIVAIEIGLAWKGR